MDIRSWFRQPSLQTMAASSMPLIREVRTDGQRTMSKPHTSGFLRRVDALWMFTAVVLTFAISYFIGHNRILWEDEMLGWMLIEDPSWHHMLHAWQLGADGGGFTFYATARAWCALFSHSVMSLRFYSAAGYAAAFCILWTTARRFYSVRTTAVALFAVWFMHPVIIVHIAEGRFYGLLMLGCTLAVWVLAKASAVQDASIRLCATAFLAHALLATSHMLGFIYSANLLFALCLLDWWRGKRRMALYASIAAAWLLLIPERTAIAATTAVGKPHFWTDPPTVQILLQCYTGFGMQIAAIELLFFACLFFSFVRRGGGWRVAFKSGFRARTAVYAILLVFFLIPIEMVAESFRGPSLLLARYMLPLAIAQVLLAAELIALTDWKRLLPHFAQGRKSLEVGLCAVLAAAVLFRDFYKLPQHAPAPLDYTQEITNRLPPGIPVLCEDVLMFTEMIGKQHTSGVNYMYLLDWPEAVKPGAQRSEVTQYHLMENWRKVGYFSGSIEQRKPFLQEHPKFLILVGGYGIGSSFTTQASYNHLVERFSRDPAYQVLPYGPKGTSGVQDTWLVCRGRCGSS